MRLSIADPEEMGLFAACCARFISGGFNLYLHGELGAGKTTFVRGLLRALDYRGTVKSPTYTLVEHYHAACYRIFHFDLYRITTPAELIDIGYRDYFDGRSICLVEWPERGKGCLPDPDLIINISIDRSRRDLECIAHTASGEQYLKQLISAYPDCKGTDLSPSPVGGPL